MSEAKTIARLSREFYAEDASAYYKTLPMEHFMEDVGHATQKEITNASFRMIARLRADVHCFSELLVQYPSDEAPYFKRVIPDNMVVIHSGLIDAKRSYPIQHQPARPFLVIEYISKESENKDSEDNYLIYERELRVPYYLLYDTEEQELNLYKLRRRKLDYAEVSANAHGHFAIPELEVELVIHDGWLRYIFRGELMELPDDLMIELKEVKAERDQERMQRLAAEAERDREREQRLAVETERDRERRERLAAEAKNVEAEAEIERLRILLANRGGDPSAS